MAPIQWLAEDELVGFSLHGRFVLERKRKRRKGTMNNKNDRRTEGINDQTGEKRRVLGT